MASNQKPVVRKNARHADATPDGGQRENRWVSLAARQRTHSFVGDEVTSLPCSRFREGLPKTPHLVSYILDGLRGAKSLLRVRIDEAAHARMPAAANHGQA